MKNLALSSLSSIIILLFVFACRDPKPVDFSNLISRGGLVYYNKPHTLISGKGIDASKTLFSGECVKYYPTGALQGKGTYNNGILVKGSYLSMDGTLIESTEIKGDNFYSNSRRPLNYIIKKPKVNLEKQNVLFFMHGHGGHIGYYEPHMINQFSDNYVKIVLRAPYETSLF